MTDPRKELMIQHLHQTRDHAHDGSGLDEGLCNCRQYINTIWPMVEMIEYQAFMSGQQP